MLWRRVVVTAAVLAALILSVAYCVQLPTLNSFRMFAPSGNSDVIEASPMHFFEMEFADDAVKIYPFAWQQAQRQRLRTALHPPESPPQGTGDMALARYADYARRHADEQVFREGMRRDRNNALYHYLLADLYIKQSLQGSGPAFDKDRGTVRYTYTITDREKLDVGMQQLAIGLQKPFRSYRDVILSEQLSALPPPRTFHDRLNHFTRLASTTFPEYSKIRNFARVNGFYLSLLLEEGKRAQAEPFLHTGERLVVQVSNDTPLSLIGQLVALAVGAICERNDAFVCRSFGLHQEAATIEQRMNVLIGELREWKDHGRKVRAEELEELLSRHGGMMPGILLPVYGAQPEGLITKETLTPSRLMEYVVAERALATGLSLFSVLLLLYCALKVWRGKLAIGGRGDAAPIIELSAAEWLRIALVGFIAPLALYLLYIAIPEISGRDHGMVRAGVQFSLGVGVFTLWTLFVPATLAAGYLWRRGIAHDDVTIHQRWRVRLNRLFSAICSGIWILLSYVAILLPTSWMILVVLFARSPFRGSVHFWLSLCAATVMLALPLLPAIWQRKHAGTVLFHLAMARGMLPVYAVMTLFFALLVPVALSFERLYIQHDMVMSTLQEGNDISMTRIEGKLSQMLRAGVRDGAGELGISWE